MKIVLFLFNGKEDDFFLKKRQEKGYKELYILAKKNGLKIYHTRIKEYNSQKKTFDKAQTFDTKTGWTIEKNITPDIVYDQSPLNISLEKKKTRTQITQEFTFVNDLLSNKLCTDKWLTYKTFKEFCPQTILVEKSDDIIKIQKIDAEKIILKPLFGLKGRGIEIQQKSKISPIEYPFIAQPFLKMDPIIGITKGQHDFRVLLANDEIFHAFVRTPSEGGYLANVSLGGACTVLFPEEVPENIQKVTKKVLQKLEKFTNKLFAIDFMIVKGKALIIELNSRPGLNLEESEKPHEKRIFTHIMNFFQKTLYDSKRN
ncbi:MAG: ATP-grasp domain-containing protein [Candidatus Moranbacteria bacterium]|nr:ATP-grasp domain-containing protein [Candidatus Moranbacteria bacterium]